jgi:hypothetical protein
MSRPNDAFDFFGHYKDMMTKFAVQDRFHLGGIVWHEGRITDASLSIIEGWLQSIGSITVVLFASDDTWYNQRLLDDDRGNMLSHEAMVKANDVYARMAIKKHYLNPAVRYAWDVKPVMASVPTYPDEAFARSIILNWFERLELLEKL